MQDRAVMQSVENGRRITKERDQEFLYAFQRAVLLALKEAGQLNETQFRYAGGKLKEQRRASTPGLKQQEVSSIKKLSNEMRDESSRTIVKSDPRCDTVPGR